MLCGKKAVLCLKTSSVVHSRSVKSSDFPTGDLQVIVFGFPMFTGDCVEFLSWFLNALHLALNGTKKLSSSIMSKTFRGKMRVYSRKVVPDGIVRTCEFTHIACILIQLHVQNSFAKRVVY